MGAFGSGRWPRLPPGSCTTPLRVTLVEQVLDKAPEAPTEPTLATRCGIGWQGAAKNWFAHTATTENDRLGWLDKTPALSVPLDR